MIYQIDSKIAKDVGFVGAILFYHIAFWIKKNMANNKHFYEGEYWTYSSIKAFSEYFEDLNERQIRYGLLQLKEKGYIKNGNFNKNPYDKTNWYGLDKKGESSEQKCPIDETKLSNRADKSVQPIPDIITDIITDNIKEEKYIKEESKLDTQTDTIKKFLKPTIEEIKSECLKKGYNSIDSQDFWEYYESKGWKVGNTPMKNWRMALSRWARNNASKNNSFAPKSRLTHDRYGKVYADRPECDSEGNLLF